MYENNQGAGGMGMTSIWDLIVLVIIARMFGFGNGFDGTNGNATTAAVTEAQIERAIRASQDSANVNNRLDAISQKQAECCCNNLLGQKDIEMGQLNLANMFQMQIAALQNDTNQHFCDAEIRGLTQRLTAAENALNNCNQTAAVSAIVNNAISPIAQTLASVVAQLNCGVKSIPYTASVPAYLPPIATMPYTA